MVETEKCPSCPLYIPGPYPDRTKGRCIVTRNMRMTDHPCAKGTLEMDEIKRWIPMGPWESKLQSKLHVRVLTNEEKLARLAIKNPGTVVLVYKAANCKEIRWNPVIDWQISKAKPEKDKDIPTHLELKNDNAIDGYLRAIGCIPGDIAAFHENARILLEHLAEKARLKNTLAELRGDLDRAFNARAQLENLVSVHGIDPKATIQQVLAEQVHAQGDLEKKIEDLSDRLNHGF